MDYNCTQNLFDQGYFKIDSEELSKEMNLALKNDNIIFLFSLFITYNNYNYYKFYIYNSSYINPDKCDKCKSLSYDITNKYIKNINNKLGPWIANLVESEKIDIFSEDVEEFHDVCKNLTIESIDIPISQRYLFFYLHENSKQIACSGINCKIKEINTDESTSVCTCKYYPDEFPEQELNNDDNMQKGEESSIIFESFGSLKCIKNGFNSNNILANGGFIINAVAIVSQIGIYVSYCLWSKALTLEKGLNPPKVIKNQIIIMTEWQKNENKIKKQITTDSDDNNNLIQPRDEDEDLMEEFMAFHNKVIDTSGYSIDTYFGNKGDDSKSKIVNHLSVNAGRRILVLIPNNRARINEKRVDLFSDSDIICYFKDIGLYLV